MTPDQLVPENDRTDWALAFDSKHQGRLNIVANQFIRHGFKLSLSLRFAFDELVGGPWYEDYTEDDS